MLVERSNFDVTLDEIVSSSTVFALDTETTGLRPYHGDKLFAIIIGVPGKQWYFNFNPKTDSALTDVHLHQLQRRLFDNGQYLWILHNAKFDMRMLNNAGCDLKGLIYDTMTMHRLVENDLPSYAMSALAPLVSEVKQDAVKAWILANKAYTDAGDGKKDYHYDQVPLDIMVPYAEKDVDITLKLYAWQCARYRELLADEIATQRGKCPSFAGVWASELALLPVVHEMEVRGVRIDRKLVETYLIHDEDRQKALQSILEERGGLPWVDSVPAIQERFPTIRLTYKKRKRGMGWVETISADSDVLERDGSDDARLILEWRHHTHRIFFLRSFLTHADENDVIHATFRQCGTDTGRFSSYSPNLQNLSKPDEDDGTLEDEPIRRCIVPRVGGCFVMMDYDQQEYRLMLNYTAPKALVEQVLAGLDVHQATADLARISRREAKGANFATVYGAGVQKLAESLGISAAEAGRIREAIDRAAPEIRHFAWSAGKIAETRGFVVNWLGRRYRFSNRRYAYRAANKLIQGGGADVMKVAMVRCARLLAGTSSWVSMTIHDELVFDMHPTDFHLIPKLKEIMETAYPARHVPLTVSVSHSWVSLADKVKGLPHA